MPRHLAAGGKSRVKLAGTLNRKKEGISSRGSRYAFLTISDASGLFEVMVFAEVLAQTRDLLEVNATLLVTVEAKMEDDQLKMTCQAIESLDQAAAKASAGLRIFIRDESPIKALRELIAKEPRGKGKIHLVAQTETREVEVWLSNGYALTAAMIAAVRTLPGIVEVQEI